jgi:hypothetical protein
MNSNQKILFALISCLFSIFNLSAQDYFDKYKTPTIDYIFSEIKKKDSTLEPKKAKFIVIDSVSYRMNNQMELDFALKSFYTDEIVDINFFPKIKIKGKRKKAKIVIITDDRPFDFLTKEAVDWEIDNYNPKKPKTLVYNGKLITNQTVPEFLSKLKNIENLEIMIFQKPYPDVGFGKIAKYGLIKIWKRK